MSWCRQGLRCQLSDFYACLQGASARQLLQVDEHTDVALREGTTAHDRLYNTSVTSNLAGKLTV